MNVVTKIRDKFVNFAAGIGVAGRDKAASSQYSITLLTRDQLEAAYRGNWIARKIIDLPPFDETREWRNWQAEQPVIEKIEEVEKQFSLKRRTGEAMVKGRLYGGAAMFIGVDQGNTQDELELDRIGKGSLKFLHVVPRQEITTGPLIRDLASPYYGEPEYYDYNPAQAAPARFHPSRVARFIGAERPDAMTANEAWGDSVIQIVDDAILAAGLVTSSIPTLVAEAKVDVIKVPNLVQTVQSEDGAAALVQRFTYANANKSVINALVLDKEEEWQRVQANMTGMPDILRLYLLIACGAADIPATRFLGQSPAGLNSTGESDIRNYYDRLAADQETKLADTLSRVDEVVIRSATGTRDPAIFYEWAPLWQLTDAEKAEVAYKKAQTAQIDATIALVPNDALAKGRQNQLIEDGTYPGLDTALEESELSAENPPEEDVPLLPPTEAEAASLSPAGGNEGEPPTGGARDHHPFRGLQRESRSGNRTIHLRHGRSLIDHAFKTRKVVERK